MKQKILMLHITLGVDLANVLPVAMIFDQSLLLVYRLPLALATFSRMREGAYMPQIK